MLIVVLGVWAGLALLYQVRPRVAVVGYLLALPAFPFYWTPFEVPVFNYLSAQQVVAAGLAIGLAIETFRAISRREPPGGLKRELLVAGLIALWSASALDIASPSAALRQLLWNLLFFWVPFALASRFCTNEHQVFFLWKWISWPALAIGVLTAYEYVTQEPVAWNAFSSIASSPYDSFWTPAMRADILRVQATLGQSIFLAFYLAFACVLLLIQSSRIEARGPRLVVYAAAVFLAVCSLLPLARGAVLALIIAVGLLAAIAHARLRRDIAIGVVLCVGALALLGPVLAVAESFWQDFLLTLSGQAPIDVQVQQLGTWEGRVNLVDVGTSLIVNAPPLGYGDVSVHGTWPILDVANVFIQVGLISGPVGLLALGVLLAVSIQRLGRVWLAARRQPAERAFATGLVAAFVVVLGSWLDASWPGQFTQLGWLTLGVISAANGWLTPHPTSAALRYAQRVARHFSAEPRELPGAGRAESIARW